MAITFKNKAKKILAREYHYNESQTLQMPEAELFNTPDPIVLPITKFGRDPLLSRNEEQLAFYRLNYSKWMICHLKGSELTPAVSREVIRWYKKYTIYKEYIVRANIGLVITIVTRVKSPLLDHSDKVSEGNAALMRAIGGFNPDRKIRFSTYACNAIIRALSRMKSRTEARYRKRIETVKFTPDCEYNNNWIDRIKDEVKQEYAGQLKLIIDKNLADLSNIEIDIIKQRFNWECKMTKPLTLGEIGDIVGLSKERVRQIQVNAIGKIRKMILKY